MLGHSIALLTLALMLASEGRRADGVLRPSLYTLAALVALAAFALVPITNALPVVGTTLTAIFGNPLSWFILFMALFFVLRPFWLKPPARLPVLDHGAPPIDADKLIQRFTNEMDQLKQFIRASLETITSNHDALQDRINAIEDVQSQNAEAFLAIYHRERMLALATTIDRESLELGKPLAEGKVMNEEEWSNWKSSALQWESIVGEWAQWASFYSGRNPMDDIKRINVEGLDENWGAKPDQFPDPEGLRVYKTFRIYVRNWANLNKVVHEKVRRKAFERVSV